MNLTTRQLRAFVLLAQTLSFHKTAEMLHVTQPVSYTHLTLPTSDLV